MDLEQVQRFLVAAKYLNFAKAAATFYIAPSTLSKSISDLESMLGVMLFTRNKQSVELTSCGKVMVEEGNKLMLMQQQAIHRVRMAEKNVTGALSIVSLKMYSQVFKRIYAEYTEKYPLDMITAKYLTPGNIAKTVECEEADLALTMLGELQYTSAKLTYRIIESNHMGVLIASSHPFASYESVTMMEIEDERLYAPTFASTSTDPSLTAQQTELVRQFRNVQFVPSEEDMLLLVSLGRGIALQSYANSRTLGTDYTFVRISDFPDHEKSSICLVWRKDNKNPALQRFCEFL